MTDPNDWIAALQRISELETQLAFDRGCAESMKSNAETMRRRDREQRDRIAELEAALQEAYGTAATFNAEAIQARARIAELELQCRQTEKERDALAARYASAMESADDVTIDAHAATVLGNQVVHLRSRIAELEAAVQHADAVVETLSAERDDALNSLAVLRVALGAPDDSEEHGTRRR